MAALNPKLVVVINLDPAGLGKGASVVKKELQNIQKEVGQSESRANRFKKSLASMWRITGGIVLFNVIRGITRSLKGLASTALDFEESMYNVNSVAHLGAKEFKDLQDQVINLALDPRVREGPESLAAGLYTVVSSGYNTADALKIMEQAAMAASAGMTTSAVAADVLVSTLGAYGLGVEHAAEMTNSLFQIVNISKYTFEDMAMALDSVTPTAAALGITIDEIGASMAVFAKHGVDAQTATVQMNATLSALLKPSDAMIAALAELGYTSGQAMIDALGYVETMKQLGIYVGDDATKAAALFGDVRALRGEMNLTNDGGKELTDNLILMGQAQDGAGAMTEALTEQMKSNAYQIDILRKNIGILAVLGFGVIAPYLNRALNAVNTFVSTFIQKYREFRSKSGFSKTNSLLLSFYIAVSKVFGPKVALTAQNFLKKLIGYFETLKKIILRIYPVVRKVFDFLLRHGASVVKIIILTLLVLKFLPPVITGVTFTVKALTLAFRLLRMAILAVKIAMAIGLDPWAIAILALIAVIALLYFAYKHNFLGFADGVHRFVKWFKGLDFKHGALGDLIDTFQDLFNGRAMHAMKEFTNVLDQIGDKISKKLNAMGLKHFATAVRDTFRDVSRAFEHLVDLVDDLAHGRWKEAWTDFKDLAIDIFWLFIDRLKMLPFLLLDIFNLIPWGQVGMTLLNGIIAAGMFLLTTGIPWMFSAGVQLVTALLNGMWDFVTNTIWPWVQSLAGWFFGLIATDEAFNLIYGAGKFLLEGMYHGILDTWDWVSKWIATIPAAIAGVFNGIFWPFYDVGKSVIEGIVQGLWSVWDKLVNVVDAVISKFKEIPESLWSNSPSKVMIEVGKSVNQGLVIGLQATMPGLETAINGVTGALGYISPGAGSAQGNQMSPMNLQAGTRTVNRSYNFAPGSIIVKEAQSGEQTAKQLLRAMRRVEAGEAD